MADPPLPGVEEDLIDPFDRLALKGQARTEARANLVAQMVSLVDLADEFGLTTAAALDLCEAGAIRADSGASMLNPHDADIFRALACMPRATPDDAAERPSLSLKERLDGRR